MSPPPSGGGGGTAPPVASTPRTYGGVGQDHKFLKRETGGDIIIVWDQFFRRTVWRVDRFDRFKTALWLPLEDVVVAKHEYLLRKYTIINIARGDVSFTDVVNAEFAGYD